MNKNLTQAFKAVMSVAASDKCYSEKRNDLIKSPNILKSVERHIQRIRKNLGKNPPTSFEDVDIRRISPELLNDVDQLQAFFEQSEKILNALDFPKKKDHSLGTDLKESWTKFLFKGAYDALTICQWANATEHTKHAKRVLDTVATKNTVDGAQSMLAATKPKQYHYNSEQSSEAALMALLQGASESQRYEMYARVDAYLRSNHAQNDLEGTDPKTEPLRKAFDALLKADPASNLKEVTTAITALYDRFDDIFEFIHVKQGKGVVGTAKLMGTLNTVRADLKISKDVERHMCKRRMGSSIVDVAIRDQQNPDKWHISLATAVSDNPTFSTGEGNQLAIHGEAMQHLFGADNVDISFVYPTFVQIYPGTGRRNAIHDQWAQLEVTADTPEAIIAFNRLTTIDIIETRTNGYNRAHTRFLTVGADLAWRTKPYTAKEWGVTVLDTINTIMPFLLNPNFDLPSNPSHVGSRVMLMISRVLNAHQRDPEFIKPEMEATWVQWADILEKKITTAEVMGQGMPSLYAQDINALQNTMQGLARRSANNVALDTTALST